MVEMIFLKYMKSEEEEIKNSLYKHANKIFWIIVALDIFGFFNRHNIFGLLQVFSLVIPYFLFKKSTKDYWFNVYYSASAINGVLYFLYVYGIIGHLFLKGIINSIIFLIGVFGGYYYFKKKHNKYITWVIYFVSIIITIFVSSKLIPN
jgi:uncharacterized membrane protein